MNEHEPKGIPISSIRAWPREETNYMANDQVKPYWDWVWEADWRTVNYKDQSAIVVCRLLNGKGFVIAPNHVNCGSEHDIGPFPTLKQAIRTAAAMIKLGALGWAKEIIAKADGREP